MTFRDLPTPLHVVNEVLAFLLELVALAALGWWGAKSAASRPVAVARGIGAPLGAAVLWWMFAAPRARIRAGLPGVLAVKALVFGSAAAAIYALEWHRVAGAFAAVAFANTALATVDRNAAMHASKTE